MDLDERIEEPEKSREEPQTVTDGGSRKIQRVAILLRGEDFPLQECQLWIDTIDIFPKTPRIWGTIF